MSETSSLQVAEGRSGPRSTASNLKLEVTLGEAEVGSQAVPGSSTSEIQLGGFAWNPGPGVVGQTTELKEADCHPLCAPRKKGAYLRDCLGMQTACIRMCPQLYAVSLAGGPTQR